MWNGYPRFPEPSLLLLHDYAAKADSDAILRDLSRRLSLAPIGRLSSERLHQNLESQGTLLALGRCRPSG